MHHHPESIDVINRKEHWNLSGGWTILIQWAMWSQYYILQPWATNETFDTCISPDPISSSLMKYAPLNCPISQRGIHYLHTHRSMGMEQRVDELINEILIKFTFYFDSKYQIRSQICTCHDSWAVMTSENLWPHWIIRIMIKTKIIFTIF